MDSLIAPDGVISTFFLGLVYTVGFPFILIKKIVTGDLEDLPELCMTFLVGLIIIVPIIVIGTLVTIAFPIVWIVKGAME